jgi:broad specificity phosphatase PhoE
LHLLLVRHGQSYVNLDDWDGGNVDTGLTPLGKRQAASLAQWLVQQVRIDALYTSTLARASETAAYLAEAAGIDAQPDDRLREFGHCYDDARPIPPEALPIHFAGFWATQWPYTPIGPNVESWLLFRVRVGRFLDDVLARHAGGEAGSTVVVVAMAV